MPLTQQTFLGASIRNFNGSLGWNNQSSNLHVGLVEDPANGDSFSPPSIGTAVTFEYSGWSYTGLLQSYQEERGQAGNPIFSVDITDARELLSGVQLILQDYSGVTYGVPNLYNIYGYLENLYGFGGSQTNETGIPWGLVRDAFYSLQLTTPIYFRGAYYLFDPFYGINIKYGINLLPSYYRIPGDCISALDYINHICDTIACDYFVEMVPLDNDDTPATNAIEVHIISRNTSPTPGTINSFIDSTDGAVAKRNGFELNNDVVSKFVVGGKLNDMYFQNQDYTSNNQDEDEEYRDKPSYYYDDIITPFWGHDRNGNLVIGTGDFNGPSGHEYTFELDGRPLFIQTGEQGLIQYRTDLAEMQAARMGQDAWESFLWLYKDDKESIHKNKAHLIGIEGTSLNKEFIGLLRDCRDNGGDLPNQIGIQHMNFSTQAFKANNVNNETLRKKIGKIYNYIKSFATDYYGKKFMVRIPFVLGAYDSETNQIRLSLKPTETGYVNEEYWGVAQFYGYMPYNPEKFTNANNKLYPYVAFTNMADIVDEDGDKKTTDLRSKYALDRLSYDSYILDQYPNLKAGEMRENLFVKCNVDENLVFLDSTTLFSPRVVITLDGPVPDAVNNTEKIFTFLLSEFKYLVTSKDQIDESVAQGWVDELGNKFGADFMWKPKEANFNIPDMAAVPLENNILRYGPWYISNTAGKVEYENDSSLVPWNYGGFTAMANAGWAKVTSALRSQQVHERGSIEFPGVPTKSMGRALLSGGPIITDINVNVGQEGVTTVYNMATWTPKFGKLGKYNVERFTQMSKMMQQQRKAFRVLFGYRDPLSYFKIEQSKEIDNEGPSSIMVAAQNEVQGSGDSMTVTPGAAIMTPTKFQKTLDDDTYINKGAMSLDGMYAPYSTDPNHSGYLSHFETPTDDASTPTVNDLNPFGSFGGKILQEGSGVPSSLDDSGNHVKGVAFRAPMVVSGWGYDTDDELVPSGINNYKNRADLWKTGPVDLRWDDDRKVWVTGTGSSGGQKIGKLLSDLTYRSTVSVLLQKGTLVDGSVAFVDTATTYEGVRDLFLPTNRYLNEGARVLISQIDSAWYVVGVAPPC